jgi:GNAT superfamily N-acetyltransferase
MTNPSPILAFVEAATAHGWTFEPCGGWDKGWKPNPQAISVGGTVYPTLRDSSCEVQVGLDSIERYYHEGKVWLGCPTDARHDLIVIAAIVVSPGSRRKRFATEAMKSLIYIADEAWFDIELEAAPISAFKAKGQRQISTRKLRDWYKSFGFKPKFPDQGESILVRKHS